MPFEHPLETGAHVNRAAATATATTASTSSADGAAIIRPLIAARSLAAALIAVGVVPVSLRDVHVARRPFLWAAGSRGGGVTFGAPDARLARMSLLDLFLLLELSLDAPLVPARITHWRRLQ